MNARRPTAKPGSFKMLVHKADTPLGIAPPRSDTPATSNAPNPLDEAQPADLAPMTDSPVGFECDRGLWVGALVAARYEVYAINPMAVSRYRDRHNLAGAKSDRG